MNEGGPIGRIQRTSLREVWKHEAHDFTRWLSENLDVLGEVIGLELTLVEREASAGDFSVDLLAEDSEGRTVVIENQLGKSDHDHLGKLMTYLAAHEAQAAIWLVGEPRPEHTKAIAWLNDSSPAAFYLLRAEAVRIENSPAALLLTLIVGPSKEAKVIAREKQEKSERHELRRQFWAALLEVAATKTKLHSNVSPSDQVWLGQSAGRTGFKLSYVARMYNWRAELYIDVDDADCNELLLLEIMKRRDEIDAAVPGLLWEPLDDKRACRITTAWSAGGYRSSSAEWPEIHRKMIDAMVGLERAIRPSLDRLPTLDEVRRVVAARTVPA